MIMPFKKTVAPQATENEAVSLPVESSELAERISRMLGLHPEAWTQTAEEVLAHRDGLVLTRGLRVTIHGVVAAFDVAYNGDKATLDVRDTRFLDAAFSGWKTWDNRRRLDRITAALP